MRKTLSPKLDVVFQALFGEVGRVGIPFNMENNRNRRKKKNIEREIRNWYHRVTKNRSKIRNS